MSRVKKLYGVTFRTSAPVGSTVSVCGDFNGWDPTSDPMVDERGVGDYVCQVALPSGLWHYKFVVDGIWCLDEKNGEFSPSGFGQYENLVEVPSRIGHRV